MTKRKSKSVFSGADDTILVAGAVIKYRRMIRREMDTIRASLSPNLMARQVKESAAHIAIEGSMLMTIYGLSNKYLARVVKEELAACVPPPVKTPRADNE